MDKSSEGELKFFSLELLTRGKIVFGVCKDRERHIFSKVDYLTETMYDKKLFILRRKYRNIAYYGKGKR